MVVAARANVPGLLGDECALQRAKVLVFGDLSASAVWRSTLLTHDTYQRPIEARGVTPLPLLQLRGHRKEMAYWGWLRVVFLGILRDHCATHIYIWLCGGLIEGAL
eukprot:15156263-Alexandrium_andersonii.AAC.1